MPLILLDAKTVAQRVTYVTMRVMERIKSFLYSERGTWLIVAMFLAALTVGILTGSFPEKP